MKESEWIHLYSQHMNSRLVDAKSSTASFLNSYASCSTSSTWWLQQAPKVGSALALNLISNNFSCQINGSFLQTQYYSSAASATPILT